MKLVYIKIKKFWSLKDTVKKMKRKGQTGEKKKIFAIHILEK